ncbi:MAG: ECF-type riboflavin transporter substrate-binding protein [Treponema sp.]|nr:ECF-type riboflavin transporter substrate-binding protein [Treponema sp.]
MKNNLLKNSFITLGAIIVGVGLFILLGVFCTIPSPILGKSIVFQYSILAAIAAVFGPVAGTITGFLGHFCISKVVLSFPYWSYIIASTLFGLVMGCSWFLLKLNKQAFTIKTAVIFNLWQIVSNALVWLVIAPLLDNLIYKNDFKIFFNDSLHIFIVNIIVTLFCGTIFTYIFSLIFKTKKNKKSEKTGSSSKKSNKKSK